jgi:hypothetical protein
VLGAACGPDGAHRTPAPEPSDPTVTTPPDPVVFTLTPVEHLLRASMALRGIRPSVADIEAVEADPSALEPIVRGYAETPEFLETMKDLHAEMLLIRADTQPILSSEGPLEGVNPGQIYKSMNGAALELVSYLINENRPYTDIVTADMMMANETLGAAYGVPFDRNSEEEWQVSRWVDGRPQSGILSDTALWLRFTSNGNNFHRGRANTIARTFLCEEFATRDITTDTGVDLSDPIAVSSLVSTNPNCIACHQALDPLAANMWGFKDDLVPTAVDQAYRNYNCEGEAQDYCYPIRFYNPKNEDRYLDWQLPPPAYYGTPVSSFEQLGQMIADDERFHQCTARRFFGYLTENRMDDVPFETVLRFNALFEASGFSAKELAIQVVLSDEFKTIYAENGGPAIWAGLQTIRPEQYGRTLEELTGFLFLVDPGCSGGCFGTTDVANNDLNGYRTMMGGIDGYQTTRPTHTPIPTKILAMSRFAEEAAGYVVPRDFDEPDPSLRHLLTLVERDTTDEALVRQQIAALHLRILGERVAVDDPEVDASYALWLYGAEAPCGDGDADGYPDVCLHTPEEAWKLLLAAFFQDVRMMFY